MDQEQGWLERIVSSRYFWELASVFGLAIISFFAKVIVRFGRRLNALTGTEIDSDVTVDPTTGRRIIPTLRESFEDLTKRQRQITTVYRRYQPVG